MRCGENFEKFGAWRRWRERRKEIGISSDMPLRQIIWKRYLNVRHLKSDYEHGVIPPQQVNSIMKDSEQVGRTMLVLVRAAIIVGLQAVAMRIAEGVARSLFAGRAGLVLFGVGFVCWNISKVAALLSP